jgi:DNA-binding transcriptional ArsR family regulator
MTSTEQPETHPTSLIWDVGTAYELFISLGVLHQPEHHGLRASWAAGVRSRIPPTERKFLEEIAPFINFPISWVYRLSEPKDAMNAIWTLRQIPAERRMLELLDVEHWDMPDVKEMVFNITRQGSWNNRDLTRMKEIFKEKHGEGDVIKGLDRYLDWWARPADFGEAMVNALQAYYLAFFSEEEKRLAPVLRNALALAQEKAKRLSIPDLITDLSQGLHFEKMTVRELIIVPAFYTTPLVVMDEIDENLGVFLFGARPATMSAIPGELVPDGLLRALKALSDPTRLKILHFLTHEELTPSELSRRLSLRAPTLTHHLSELRLAGLVNLTIKGQEKLYRARLEAMEETFGNLQAFLKATDGD